jgi:hypothetical protein
MKVERKFKIGDVVVERFPGRDLWSDALGVVGYCDEQRISEGIVTKIDGSGKTITVENFKGEKRTFIKSDDPYDSSYYKDGNSQNSSLTHYLAGVHKCTKCRCSNYRQSQ